MQFVSKFASNKRAHELFYQYVRDVIGRTNRYTGKRYSEDPAIMSWQIGNEPRAFSNEAKQPFAQWLAEASALIRSLDPNHLISIGSEGKWGCEEDMGLYEQICSDANIDYMNIHLWPYNWSWVHQRTLRKELPNACTNTKEYIDEHLVLSAKLRKPLVLEEFGFPRDGFSFSQESTTTVRDDFYRFVFGLVVDNALQGGQFAGCNFWGWGGRANPKNEQWRVGDDYTGDPAQEAQGLNSVFFTDKSTIDVIRQQVERIKQAGK
jgi:mannan endo-1,4-beta-mannosidase